LPLAVDAAWLFLSALDLARLARPAAIPRSLLHLSSVLAGLLGAGHGYRARVVDVDMEREREGE